MLIPDILTESKTVNSHIFKKIKAGKCRSSVSLNRNLKPPHSILAFKLSWFGIPSSKFNLLCLLFLLTYFTAQRLETKEGSLSLKVITSCDQNYRWKLKTFKSHRLSNLQKEVIGKFHSYLSSDEDSCSTFIPSERLPLNLSSFTLLLLLRLRPPRDRDRLLRRDLLLRPLSLFEENREI